MLELLRIIRDELKELSLPYALGEWNGAVSYPYFVGSLQLGSNREENALQRGSFTLDGWSRSSVLELLEWTELLYQHFRDFRRQGEEGLYWLHYQGCQVLPTGQPGLYRVQLTLEWWSFRV